MSGEIEYTGQQLQAFFDQFNRAPREGEMRNFTTGKKRGGSKTRHNQDGKKHVARQYASSH